MKRDPLGHVRTKRRRRRRKTVWFMNLINLSSERERKRKGFVYFSLSLFISSKENLGRECHVWKEEKQEPSLTWWPYTVSSVKALLLPSQHSKLSAIIYYSGIKSATLTLAGTRPVKTGQASFVSSADCCDPFLGPRKMTEVRRRWPTFLFKWEHLSSLLKASWKKVFKKIRGMKRDVTSV